MDSEPEVVSEIRDSVAWITLNRPAKRNALSEPLMALLSELLWQADEDNRVRCVVLRAAGPDFSSGYDLQRYDQPVPGQVDDRRGRAKFDDDAWHQERAQRHRMALFDMHKPVIAQVQGRCLAGGTDLALLCDMVICADDAVFGFPPARSQGSLPSHMWLYLVGPQWAKRLLLTGDSIRGTDAVTIGLALKAVPAADLASEVATLAARLALIDADLLSANKRIVNIGLDKLGEAMSAIPPGSWPYGRVVAVEEAHQTPAQQEPMIRRNVEATVSTLNDLGIAAYDMTAGNLR